MDFKKIGLIAGGVIISFGVMFLGIYFLYPYINPEQQELAAKETETPEQSFFDPDSYSPKNVESLRKQLGAMQGVIDSLKQREAGYAGQVDSLNAYIVDLERQQEALENTPGGDTVQEAAAAESEEAANSAEVSKSLLNMDEDELAPIINLLDDNRLVSLYNAASNMQRAKLLRTLKPDRAAKILKKVM